MYTIELPEYLVHCPTYWQKFAMHCFGQSEMELELEKHNAKIFDEEVGNYEYSTRHCWVEFESEADYLLFRLKWA